MRWVLFTQQKNLLFSQTFISFIFLYFHLCSLVSLTIIHGSHVLIKYNTWLFETLIQYGGLAMMAQTDDMRPR
jgi:hypothetical protein